MTFPSIRLRHSSSDGGVSKPNDCCFGIQTTRTANGNRFDKSTKMVDRLLNNSIGDDPVASTITGIDSYAYIFTLDDVITSGSGDTTAYYDSGSRCVGESKTATAGYASLLDAGFDSFTAPFWGGFDGLGYYKARSFL
jgi:hypothetical protein